MNHDLTLAIIELKDLYEYTKYINYKYLSKKKLKKRRKGLKRIIKRLEKGSIL